MKYKEGLEEIATRYKSGQTFEKIKSDMGVSGTKIKNALIKNGITARSTGVRKISVNENYFDVIDSNEKAYFLGLLFADGCNNGEGFYLILQERDGSIIKKLKKCIDYKGELKTIQGKKENHQNYLSLNISSHKLSKSLDNLGCVKNKTKYATFPKLTQSSISHFIRGYFDGDGSISIDKKNQLCFSIVGNSDIVSVLKAHIDINCKVDLLLTHPKRYKQNIAIIQCAGNKQCKRIYQYLYENSTISLKRKQDKFEQICK